MDLKRIVVTAVLPVAFGAVVAAQQSISKMGEVITSTAVIEQIDATSRMITFKGEDGTEDTVWAGPEVKRFKELKVGDKVNMRYYESTVYNIRKPGDPPLALGSKGDAAVTAGRGALPGGTVAHQKIKTVSVKSVDPHGGSITFTTSDGHTITRKVEDKSHLAGVNPGDHIDIVYTEALLASVERAK
jgi:Cu/Ag efflux protein CusF